MCGAFFDFFKLGMLAVAAYQFNVNSGALACAAVRTLEPASSLRASTVRPRPTTHPTAPPRPPANTPAAFLAAVQDLAGASNTGLNALDKAVEVGAPRRAGGQVSGTHPAPWLAPSFPS